MSEKTKILAVGVGLLPLILGAGVAISYVVEGGIFGQPFFSGAFFGVFYCGLLVFWSEAFTQSVRERRRNKAGAAIAGVPITALVTSPAALLINSCVNGYRMM